MEISKLQDKIRGSVVGGAVGDALGYPVEFIYSYEEICAKYGDDGVTEYDLSYPWLPDSDRYCQALFSDDTQMTLYTAEGLLEAEKSGKPIPATVCNAYLAWWGGQVCKNVKILYESELAKISAVNQRRAPGNTCISALFQVYNGKDPINGSKGCGGIMRVAPVGLYGAVHDWPLEKTARLAGELAEITHLHPLSTYSSAALAVIVQLCTQSEEVDVEAFKAFVRKSLEVIGDVYGKDANCMEELTMIVEKAIRLETNLLRDWEIIENGLGGGWVAEETLAIALFSVVRHIDDFDACIRCSVNHGGDSDSTGAVAGNILGAILGYNAIPEKYTTDLQLTNLLLNTADRLVQ